MHRLGCPPMRGPEGDAAPLLWFTRAMSPTPRKPAKPKPKVVRDQAALERALGTERQAAPPPDVAIRWSGKLPSGAALKKMGVDDRRMAELAKHLKEHGEEIATALREDRELAELFATDPSGALERLKLPEELRTGGDDELRKQLLERFRGVRLDLPTVAEPATDQPSAATLAAVQLIADTFHDAAADPGRFAELRTDPTTVVTSVAAANPPQGVAAGSAAAASIVSDVSTQIAAVYGVTSGGTRPPWLVELDPGVATSVRIPRVPKGR